MNILIKNEKCVDCSQSFVGDIYIENGVITEIGKDLNKDNVQIIDAKGLTVMPSFVDTHAHFRDPGLTWKEDIETGSKAVGRGCYT